MRAVVVISIILLQGMMGQAQLRASLSPEEKARVTFEEYVRTMHHALGDTSLHYKPLHMALRGYYTMKAQGKLQDTTTLTVIDFTMSGNRPRMFVIDLKEIRIKHRTLVAHGQKTGAEYARKFSNESNSHQSSIGFYVTGDTWQDKRLKRCMRIKGLEFSNDNAWKRGVIVHAADYACQDWIDKYGTLGRSYGCPSLPFDNYDDIIDDIQGGSCYFIYYPERRWLKYSRYINSDTFIKEFARERGIPLS